MIEDAHPFLIWFAYMKKRRLIEDKGNDLVVNEIGSKRFGLGVEDAKKSGHPVLGLHIQDADAFQSLKWSSAGIVMGHLGKDWIVIAADDIRQSGSSEPAPVPMRVWIQFPTGSLDGFLKNNSKIIDLKRIKKGNGAFPIFEKTPFETLSLSKNDKRLPK